MSLYLSFLLFLFFFIQFIFLLLIYTIVPLFCLSFLFFPSIVSLIVIVSYLCERYRCLSLSAVLYCNIRSDEHSFFPHLSSSFSSFSTIFFPSLSSQPFLIYTLLSCTPSPLLSSTILPSPLFSSPHSPSPA